MIEQLQDRGFMRLYPNAYQDFHGGRLDLDRARCCSECVGRLSSHPHIRFLRARNTAVPTSRVVEKRPPEKVGMSPHVRRTLARAH